MPEAVIVAAARSPIGRAFKGSLTTIRPDDLTVQMVRAALAQVPQLDPSDIDDLMLGCGLPGGEQGFNMARVVAVLLGHDTPARHHRHPLLLVVAADHPHGHARHQGRRGRRVRLGRRGDGVAVREGQLRLAAPTPATRSSPTPRTAPRHIAENGAYDWSDPRADEHLPDVYIAMGQTAENLARRKGVTREDMDHFGVRSQNLAEKAIADGFFAREITPVTLPDGTVVEQRRRAARGRHLRGGQPAQAGVPAGRPGHRRQLLPAQRRRRRARDHVRHEGRRAGHHPAGPRGRHRRVRALPGDHGPRPGRGLEAGARPRRHDHRRRRPRRDQRGVRGAGPALGPRPGHRRGEAERQRRAPSRSATRSA